ncbi:hypothetical protein BGZ54_006322 [Gamsiella multidivaricata]|nr:hypothetical protein BGZ54_006322 [Gamsiella multidivaricata]
MLLEHVGFGRALATRIIGKGAKVILAGNDIKDGERLADELNSGKDAKVAHFAQCDVTNYSQQAEIFKAAETYFGRVDIVVNNVVSQNEFLSGTTTAEPGKRYLTSILPL